MYEEYEQPIVWLEHIGEKADIVNGDIVLSTTGFLTISKEVASYNLLIDKGVAIPLCPKSDYRGRAYRFRKADCVALVIEWMDAQFKYNFADKLYSKGLVAYRELARQGFEKTIQDFGFVTVDTPQYGDVIFYTSMYHIGVYLENNTILHHPQSKFSCIDQIDASNILKIYRYAN